MAIKRHDREVLTKARDHCSEPSGDECMMIQFLRAFGLWAFDTQSTKRNRLSRRLSAPIRLQILRPTVHQLLRNPIRAVFRQVLPSPPPHLPPQPDQRKHLTARPTSGDRTCRCHSCLWLRYGQHSLVKTTLTIAFKVYRYMCVAYAFHMIKHLYAYILLEKL